MLRRGLQHEQVTQAADEVEREAAQVVPLVDQACDGGEQPCEVARDQAIDDVGDRRARSRAEDLRDVLGRDATAGEGEHLLEDRQRVAHRPVAGPHDRVDRDLLDGRALSGDDAHHVGSDVLGIDAPQVEPLHARQDRRQHLLRIRRRHREHHVTGRLLDEFEQRVERRGRGHVHLVEDVDLASTRRRGELGALAQVTRVIDTAVRRHVELDDVERGPRRDRRARLADTAGGWRGPFDAVDGFGEDPSDRRLPRPAWTGEQVGVMEPVLGDRVGERADHRSLTDDVGEGTRPVAAVQRLVRHPTALPWERAPASMRLRTRGGIRRRASDRHPSRDGLGLLPLGPDPVHHRTSPGTPVTASHRWRP